MVTIKIEICLMILQNIFSEYVSDKCEITTVGPLSLERNLSLFYTVCVCMRSWMCFIYAARMHPGLTF